MQNALLKYLDGRRTSWLEGREFAEIDNIAATLPYLDSMRVKKATASKH